MAILRNVAKSDTFERQRQTINQIAQDIYNLGGGGSDLSTGLLRLGDGTRTTPSLSFANDTSVGIYRPDTKQLAFVNDGKKLHQLQNEASFYYRNLILQKNILETDGLSITDEGQNYDPGQYQDIAAVGGTGQAGTLDLTVSAFSGTTTPGSGYVYPSTGAIGGGGSQQFSNVKLTGGNGSDIEVSITFDNGGFSETDITEYGSGYQINDVLSLPVQSTGNQGTATLDESTIVMSSNAGIFTGWTFTQTGGTAVFETPTDIDGNPIAIEVQSVDSLGGTDISLNTVATTAGTVTFTITPPWGTNGNGYQYTIDTLGIVTSVAVNQAGEGYSVGDTLSVFNLDLTAAIVYTFTTEGLVQPSFTTTVPSGTFVVGQQYVFQQEDALNPGTFNSITMLCEEVYDNGSEILVVTFSEVTENETIGQGDTISGLEIDEIENPNRYLVDFDDPEGGNAPTRYPDMTLFVNNKYSMDYSNANNHPVRFSIHPGGTHNKYEEAGVTVTEGSNQFTVADASGILIGMEVTTGEGGDINDTGSIGSVAFVTAVNGNTITMDVTAAVTGTLPLLIQGVEYTGQEVVKNDDNTVIAPNASTPTTLYYYCENHPNMGGLVNNAAEITIDPNNTKVFGSGFEITVTSIVSTDNVTLDVSSGGGTFLQVTSDNVTSDTATIETINTTDIIVDTENGKVSTEYVLAPSSLKIETTGLLSPLSLKTAKVSFVTPGQTEDTNIEIFTDTGDVITSGQFKTTGVFNSSDLLKIEDNKVEAQGTSDLLLNPAPNRVTIIGGTQALQIPAGNTAARPAAGLTNDGAIRYNTQTTQYEGYSSATNSWSSLGGIRDLDGNTYVTAEESVGANDDTFYFYNGNINTIRITPNKLRFEELKAIASLNTSAPVYTEWFSNTPVTLGQYLKYRNNIYEVTGAGVTATDGSAPTHTSGAQPNNTCELTFYSTAVGNLLFQEIDEVQVDPFGDTYLTISGDLRLRNNVVGTDINDLILRPNAGKKVKVDGTSTLVLPVGNENERGAAETGSIRFNTDSLQYEGYDGTNWGSLGGVKDVDQNTYIIPETSPGANENILYFYNNGVNTMQLSTSSLDLTNIDTFTSINNTSLTLEFKTFTLDTGATVIDNTAVDTTFLYNTKQFFKFGMSAGLTVDPLLILEDTGDIFYNTGFGTGSETKLKLLNDELTDFEIRDYKVQTSSLELIRGTTDVGSALLYNTTTQKGCKVMVILDNTVSNKSSFMEFNVVDDGTEVYYNEYAGVNTSEDAATVVFDIDVDNNARITFTLTSDHAVNDNIKITVVAQILK